MALSFTEGVVEVGLTARLVVCVCALIRRLGEEDDIAGYCGHNNYIYDHFEITHEHNTTIVYCKLVTF